MTTPDQTPLGEPARRLNPNAKGLLIAWTVVVVALAVVAFLQTRGGEGFDDLARFVGLLLAAIALAGIGLMALLIRQFITSDVGQTLAAIFGPPVVAALAIFAVRLTG